MPESVAVGPTFSVASTGRTVPGRGTPVPGDIQVRSGIRTDDGGAYAGMGVFLLDHFYPVSCIHIRSDTKSRGPTPGRPGSPAPWVPSDRSPSSPIIMGVMQLTGRSLAGARHGVWVPGLRYPVLGVLGPGPHRSWAPDTRYLTSGAGRRDDGPDAHGDLTARQENLAEP